MSDHWAAPYIGMPASDCWAFARRVWQDRWHVQIPAIPYDATDLKALRRQLEGAAGLGWAEVTTPREGDAVLMSMGRRPCHVGVWIEPDEGAGVLHWVEGAGVMFTAAGQLSGMGYAIHGFWRHPDLGGLS